MDDQWDIDFTEILGDMSRRDDQSNMDATTYQSEFLDAGHLFQVFVDPESTSGDVLIKMYDQNVSGEKYLCVDLEDGGIDLLDAEDFSPSSFVLQIPASQVKKKTLQLTDHTRSKMVLYKNQESLYNANNHLKGMYVRPPPRNINCDQSVFSDILTITPLSLKKGALF